VVIEGTTEFKMTKSSNKEAIFAALDRGASRAKIIADFHISKQAVAMWVQKWKIERSIVNGSIDQSTAQSHSPNGSPHETSPVAMPLGERKGDRGLDQTPTRAMTWAEKTALVVEAIVDGGVSRTAAYSYAGIPPSSGRLRFQQDETFRAAILEAEARLEMGPAKNLKRLAESNGPQAHIASAIYLSRRFPAEWAERRNLNVDVMVEIGASLELRKIMQSPRLIELASEMEAERQRIEAEQDARQLPEHSDAIDVDFREVESHE
jgi:hypothetical protein